MSLGNFRLINSDDLVDCVMGRKPADLVIRGGKWVSVQSGEIIPGTDIAVINGRIAYVGVDAGHTIGPETRVIDAKGRFLVPGLIDGHMHIESGMLTVTEFVRAVLPHGTTTMFVDPHEIANVLGIKGVKMMADEAIQQPVHVFVQVPSCVPSAPGLETAGAVIGPDEVREAFSWPGVYGLGEVMNYPGVVNLDKKISAEIRIARELGFPIGGHYPAADLGSAFHAYAAGGPGDDHEGTRYEDAIARVRQGMYVMMRYGSGWKDVAELIRAVTEAKLDTRHFILCTDDSHSHTLHVEGHIDRVLRHAISQGVSPLTAIQMVTINTAEYLGLSKEIGMIAPGRYADILLVENLVEMNPDLVIAKGEIAAEEGQLLLTLPTYEHPKWALDSIHLKNKLTAADFRFTVPSNNKPLANVIGVIEDSALTKHLKMPIEINDGDILIDKEMDIAKIAIIDRHLASGRVSLGLVHGFGFDCPCAVASTVAHDSHQLIVAGTDEESMAQAANHLLKIGGGQVVIKFGKVIGEVNLPIGGIISSENAALVSEKAGTILEGFKACGCKIENPNMQFSLLGLPVIPELRITDLGLADVNGFKLINLLD